METQLDKFGRVVIPKALRDHLGLKTGTILQIEERNHGIVLKQIDTEPQIQFQGGVAVYMGKATEKFGSIIQDERDDRLDKLEGG